MQNALASPTTTDDSEDDNSSSNNSNSSLLFNFDDLNTTTTTTTTAATPFHCSEALSPGPLLFIPPFANKKPTTPPFHPTPKPPQPTFVAAKTQQQHPLQPHSPPPPSLEHHLNEASNHCTTDSLSHHSTASLHVVAPTTNTAAFQDDDNKTLTTPSTNRQQRHQRTTSSSSSDDETASAFFNFYSAASTTSTAVDNPFSDLNFLDFVDNAFPPATTSSASTASTATTATSTSTCAAATGNKVNYDFGDAIQDLFAWNDDDDVDDNSNNADRDNVAVTAINMFSSTAKGSTAPSNPQVHQAEMKSEASVHGFSPVPFLTTTLSSSNPRAHDGCYPAMDEQLHDPYDSDSHSVVSDAHSHHHHQQQQQQQQTMSSCPHAVPFSSFSTQPEVEGSCSTLTPSGNASSAEEKLAKKLASSVSAAAKQPTAAKKRSQQTKAKARAKLVSKPKSAQKQQQQQQQQGAAVRRTCKRGVKLDSKYEWDEHLLMMPRAEFVRFTRTNKNLTADQLDDLRQTRRRMKNRLYQKDARDRRFIKVARERELSRHQLQASVRRLSARCMRLENIIRQHCPDQLTLLTDEQL